MVSEEQSVLVLRMPGEEGNYAYRLAALSHGEAPRWEQLLARGDLAEIEPRVCGIFGPPIDLNEAMDQLSEIRNFKVIDLPGDPT